MAKFENLPNQITDLATEWDGHSGMEVEDFISRKIEKTEGLDIINAEYDVSTSTLKLIKNNGSTVETEVSVIPPTYSYGIKVCGLVLNNDFSKIYTDANPPLTMQYNSDKSVKVGIAMYAVATTSVTADRIGPFNVKLAYGSLSSIYRVANIKYDLCIVDSSTGEIKEITIPIEDIAWIDVTKLFSKSQSSAKVTATVVDDTNVHNTLNLPITTEVISLSHVGDIITGNNSVNFSLTGGITSNYHLEVFNNGASVAEETASGVLSYTNLVPGLNLLAVRAVHNIEKSTIYTDYVYIDVIYTLGCENTIVAVNGVSNGILNNGIATLYNLAVYSPYQESVEITTYLETDMPNASDLRPTEIMKYEIIDASAYKGGNTYSTSYMKYIEINSIDSTKYLLIKVNDSFYNFYTVFKGSDGSLKARASKFLTMKVEAVNPNLIYYQDIQPNFNFDLIGGYLNNVFVTEAYATPGNPANITPNLESSDGWLEHEGRTYFKVSALKTPIFKSPINLNLGNSFTIEMGFRTYNISNENSPIVSIGYGNSFLELRPTLLCWKVDNLEDITDPNQPNRQTFNSRNAQFKENDETHILITVLKGFYIKREDLYYPDFLGSSQDAYDKAASSQTMNLIRIYVNGVIDREINLSNTEIDELIKGTLQINPTTADIDFYLFRVYNTAALNFNLVQLNYISFLKDRSNKEVFFDKNDILGSSGTISFEKCYKKYNTLVHVYPKGGKFPHRFWGGADGSAVDSINKKLPSILFVGYADGTINKQYGGKLTLIQTKGLGSSAMRYLIWNVTAALNKFKDSEGKKIKSKFTPYKYLDEETNTFLENAESVSGYYIMPHYDGLTDLTEYHNTKMVGKVNFASSMQSHKVGACKLFDDAYKSTMSIPCGGRKAVHQEPFLYFYWESELSPEEVDALELADVLSNNDKVKFMGFLTWGPGKGDDAESGYDEDETPEYMVLEGGENTDPVANFRRPWLALQRGDGSKNPWDATYSLLSQPTVTYEESLVEPWKNLLISDESVVYAQRGTLDIDYGVEELEQDGVTYFQFAESVHESLKKFREFMDFVYTHDFTFEISSDLTPTNWDITKKYVSGSSKFSVNSSSHKIGDMYRYDDINETWVCAGERYNSTTGWSRVNLYDLTPGAPLGDPELAREELKIQFKLNIGKYVNVNDIAFHQAFIKFVSGTDNRAKNTYFLIIGNMTSGGGDYLVRLMADDLDTILVTDNNGLQSKPYNLLESSYRPEDDFFWGDANNIFFKMFDKCFEKEIKVFLSNIISKSFNKNNVDDTSNYFHKVFFDVQTTLPAIAYNHTAKIYYENAQSIYDSSVMSEYKNNNINPIEQSHGSCLACEKQFMSKRLSFLTTYACPSKEELMKTAASGGEGTTLSMRLEFEPYQDFYPNYFYGKDIYLLNNKDGLTEEQKEYDSLTRLAQENKTYVAEVKLEAKEMNLGLYSVALFKKLNILGLKDPVMKAGFNRSVEFEIDNSKLADYPTLFKDYPPLILNEFTPSFPVLEKLKLSDMELPASMDLSMFYKLLTVDLSNTTVKNVIFPQSGRLKTVILPNTIESFRIYDNPGLEDITFEGLTNLSVVYIDCNKCGSFNVANFCEELVNCNTLTSVTIRNANLRITEEALRKLILAETCIIEGDIHIITSTGALKEINFDTKLLLVNTFGDISNSSSKIRIHYLVKEILDFSCASEISIYRQSGESGTIVRPNMFDIKVSSGNDVVIKSGTNPFNNKVNGYLDISYSITSNPNYSIDPLTGAITMKEEVTTPATVTIKMKVANSALPLTKTVRVSFTWKAPQLGDFAYADGTFTSSYDSTKTMIGLVYAKLETNSTSGTVYIIGKEYANSEHYLGYTIGGEAGATNVMLLELYQVSQFLTGKSINNYEEISGIASVTPINDITALNYKNEAIIGFNGDSDTLKYIDKVNSELLPYLYSLSSCKPFISRKQDASSGWLYSINSLEDLKSLCEVIQTIHTYAFTTDIMTCLLYPYFYSMYLYLPVVKEGETLNIAYQKGKWYVPSVNEFSRIIYYRGYSATGDNFNTSEMVRQAIDEKIANKNGVLTTPIFSMASSRALKKFPIEWANIVGSGTSSGVNNITTSINSTEANNYSYLRVETYGYPDYKINNNWVIGGSADSYTDSSKTNAWRLTKHRGVPFTKFNYSKNG